MQIQKSNNSLHYWRHAAIGASVFLMCFTGAVIAGNNAGGYVTDPGNHVWKDSAGRCYTDPSVSREAPRAECDDDVKTTTKPQPASPVDNDDDGVPDNTDQCPGTPPAAPVNTSGCPLAKQAPVILKGVTFEFNSARLTGPAGQRLNNVANALKSSPEIDIRIKGHTDSIGSAAYNLKLSRERGASVQRYLVSHGIGARRLSSQGFGETRPIAPNVKPNGADNPAGRAQNRRVELHVVK